MADNLQQLGQQECYDRLRTRSVGRVAVTHRALPTIVPVNYALLGSTVVFRTQTDGMLARACQGNVVAFEVDALADDGRSGWSVVVVGVAEVLTGSLAMRALETGLVSAAGDGRELFIGISAGQVTGRAVEPAMASLA